MLNAPFNPEPQIPMPTSKHIAITGASSGIGAALAEAYAAPGVIVSLQGRNMVRLNAVAEKVERRGGRATIKVLDVTDAAGMKEWLVSCDKLQPIDLVIANAGISAGTGRGAESAAQAHAIFATNVMGVLNTVHPIIPLMTERKKGQIAIMASLAGFRGLSGAPSYGASKAAVRIYGEGLRGALARHGIEVNVICPGFVKTPMTEVNRFPMPFLMTPERAATIIKQGLELNRPRIAFPWPMYALVWLFSILPLRLTDAIIARLPKK